MIDVEWNDNAKAAVNAYNDWALENDLGVHAFFEHLTNNGHTQPKTVADAVEQEGEKWTHTTSSGHKCKIYANEPDKRGAVVVVNSEGYYMLDCAENLKPIEYVISKSEAWDRLNSGEFYCMEYGVSKLKQLYDII